MRLGKCIMKDQKGAFFYFILMSNTGKSALCSVSREPAVRSCDEHMYIHTQPQEAHTTDLISMGHCSPVCSDDCSHATYCSTISTILNKQGGKENREGWFILPLSYPSSKLTPVPPHIQEDEPLTEGTPLNPSNAGRINIKHPAFYSPHSGVK